MRILIADDHDIVRKGVISLLKIDYTDANIIEAANGIEVIDYVNNHPFDFIILDINMPQKNGMEVLKEIRGKNIKTPVLMLSMQPEDPYAIRCLKAGASGFVSKENARAELLVAMRTVLGGKNYLSPAIENKLTVNRDANKARESLMLLSDREMQVLILIGSGKTVTEIAEQLSLSTPTVSTFRARLLSKLELNNNADLTRFAIENGLV